MYESTTMFSVEGMNCGGCARDVHAALLAIPGVAEVTTDPQTATATIRAHREIDRSTIGRVLKDAGFGLK